MEKTVRFGVSIPLDLLEEFDNTLKKKSYPNRSEAIRDLIRDFIAREKAESTDEEGFGSLDLVYDHEKRGISDKLVDLQHKEHGHILSSMHIHLDERYCLEMIAMKGKASRMKSISDKLTATKGVRQGKLTMIFL